MQAISYWTLITRHICLCFDARPDLRPSVQRPDGGSKSVPDFTEEQLAQIRDIFALFDLDASGEMDRQELDVAMVALGLHSTRSVGLWCGCGGHPRAGLSLCFCWLSCLTPWPLPFPPPSLSIYLHLYIHICCILLYLNKRAYN